MAATATDAFSGFRRFGRVGQSRAGWPKPSQRKQSPYDWRRAYSSTETLFRVAPSERSMGPAWVPVTAALAFVGVAAVVAFAVAVVVVVGVGVLQELLARAFCRDFRDRILLSRRWQSATQSVRVFGSRSL